MTPTATLIQDDCLEAMRKMPDASVDAIVTDPPYGLSQASKRNVRSLNSAMLEVVFPDLADLYAKGFSKAELPFPRDSVLYLDWALRSFGVKTRVGVPKGSVDFKGNAVARKEEVEAAGIGAVGVPDGVLMDEANAALSELLGEYVLSFRPLGHSAFSDCERIGLRELGSGRFSVPVVVPADSRLAAFLLSNSLSYAASLADFVRLGDDAPAEPKAAPFVVASAAAELVFVLSFDTTAGTCEVIPASGASQLNLIAQLVSAERVTARPAAGGLPAVFKAHGFSLVGDAAGGTFTVNFHREFLSCLNSSRGGFMGQAWDYDVPSVEIWAECLRVLKPGGHLLAFAGTRTQHRMAVRIEDAGFEIRDMIAWVYGSGFPKSHNLHGEWQGWGTALKPALEPITVARKPLSGTVAENVLAHGTGALNVDGCRVAHGDQAAGCWGNGTRPGGFGNVGAEKGGSEPCGKFNVAGRWPANLIHDGSEEVVGLFPVTGPSRRNAESDGRECAFYQAGSERSGGISGRRDPLNSHNDAGGSAARFFYCAKAASNERLSFLTCNCQTVKHCSWVKLDQNQNAQTHSTSPAPDTSEETSQDDLFSSTSPSGKPKTAQSKRDTSSTTSTETGKTTASKISNSSHQQNTSESTEDAKSGTENGSSHAVFAGDRFQSMPGTSICLQKDGRFMGVVANATSPLSSGISECEGCGTKIQRTAHPTQKPEDLMRYLCRLVTPPGGTVLDPFMGSGSTGKAALAEGFNFIGIERDPQYFQIAQKRAQPPHQTTLPLP